MKMYLTAHRAALPLAGRRALILAGSIAALLSTPSLTAATKTFDGGVGGTSSALDPAANWVGDVLPSTGDEVLLDNSVLATLPAQLTTTGASVTYGDLIWNTNNSSTITINTTTATSRTITLSGGGGGTAAAAGTVGGNAADLLTLGLAATSSTLTIGGNAGAGTARLGLIVSKAGNFDVVNSGATLNLTAAVSGAFALTKTGAGTLVLAGANTFGDQAIPFTITSGTVQTTGSGTLGSKLGDLVVNGSLDLSGTSQTVDSLTGTGAIFNNGTGISTLTIGNDFTGGSFGGTIADNTNATSSVTALTKIGTGTASITSPQSFSGATTVNLGYLGNSAGAGALALSGNTGRLPNSVVTLNGTTLTTSSAAAGTIVRASGLTLNNATVAIGGNNVGNTVETITNALNLGGGRSTVTITPNTGRNVLLNAGSLSRNTGGTVLVRGTSLGLSPLATAAANTTNVSFVTAPILSGSGPTGTSTVGILPWAYGDNSITGSGTDFLTYETTNGLRRLAVGEFVVTFASGNTTLDNARLSTAISNVNTATALNSLTLTTGSRVNGTGTLTVSSGGILALDNASIGTLSAGGLNFGTAEGILTAVAGKTLTVASTVTGSGGLTAGGPGTVTLTGANSFTGGTYLASGVLKINSDTALGSVPGVAATNLTFSGGTLQAGAAGITLGVTRNVVSAIPTLNATFDTNNNGGNALSIAGVISGAGGLNKIGAGTLTISGANTYSGATNATGGTLNVTGSLANTSGLFLLGGEAKLDFSAATAPASNILNSNSALTFNSGAQNIAGVTTLTIQGKDNAASTQTFAGTTFANFASHLTLAPGGGTGTLNVNLGSLTRITLAINTSNRSDPVGATLDVTIPTGVTVAASVPSAGLSGAGANSVVRGATVNANTWATITSGNLVGTTSYSNDFATAGVNLDVIGDGTLTADPNTIRFNTPLTTNVTLGVTPSVRDVPGGVLVTSAVGANLSRISGGFLQGISRRDSIFIQNNTAGDLQIDSIITDFGGASAQGIAKSGPGRMILTATNTQTGAAVINEGTVVVTGDGAPAVAKASGSNLTASNLISGLSDTTGVFIGQRVTNSNTTAFPTGTTFIVTAFDATSVTLSSNAAAAATGGYSFSAGGGLGGATSGATSVNSVAAGATLQIGNGGTTGSLAPGQGISANGSLIFNRSSALIYGAVAGEVISGAGSVTQTGPSALTLSGTNTYTGATLVANAATLIAGSGNAFGVNSAATVATGGLLQLAGRTVSIGSLAGNGTLENANATSATLTLGGDNTSTNFSGTLQNGTGAGTLSITKVGTGGQTFSGPNTSTGSLLINAGSVSISGGFAGPIQIGAGTGAIGILNILSGASINANVTSLAPSVTPAQGAGSVGAVYQSGGAVTYNAQFLLAFGGGGASGFYNLSGGSVTDVAGAGASNERFRIGGASINSTGVFYQSGGSVTLLSGGPVLEVGANTSSSPLTNSAGIAYFTGGTFSTGSSGNRIGFDNAGGSVRGEETIAGTASVTINGATTLGQAAGDIGILNLNGGTFATRSVVKGTSGIGRVNFNGGTLKAAASATGATYFTGLTSATIFSGGASVDANSQSLTIAQPLLAASGNGVTTIPVSNGGVGYVGAPVVSLTGGGGTGATAVANMTDDGTGSGTFRIASITVTNPGNDYTSAPTVSFTGGGGSGTIPGIVTTAANAAGGLSKIGLGSLALAGANTYTGPTNVLGGTLEISGTINSNSAVTVSNGMLLLSSSTGVSTATPLALGNSVGSTSGLVQLGNGLNNVTETFGPLALAFDSTLDFGTGTGGQDLLFAGVSRVGGSKLSILNWSGTPSVAGTTSQDRLLFTTGDSTAFTSLFPNQADVSFNGVPGYTAFDFGGGTGYEIVAVPEPSSVALLGGLGLLGMLRFGHRRSQSHDPRG